MSEKIIFNFFDDSIEDNIQKLVDYFRLEKDKVIEYIRDVHLYCTLMAYRVRGCTTSGRYVRIIDLREGNEESSEETTGCKASVYAEFDDCPRVGKFVKLLDFRHFERHMMFSQSDRKTYKKAISDGVNVSVVLDVGCGNT